MHRSSYSWVAAASLNLNVGSVWLGNTFIGYNPYTTSTSSYYEAG
jgi:hypothetical protein